MRRIVGLCGAAGSGKDASADVLIREYGFVKRSFAEALREEVSLALNDEAYRNGVLLKMPTECRDALMRCIAMGDSNPWRKPTGGRMRRLLQLWGTEFRRSMDPDYWIKREAETLPSDGNFVYTDVRFPNEESHIKSNDGVVVRVMRPGYGPSDHTSEQHYLRFNCMDVIHNNGTLSDLKREVRSVVWMLEDQ